MGTITFDTLEYVAELESAGVPTPQAKAEARALSRVFEVSAKDLATKEDVKQLKEGIESRTDSKFDLLRKDMDAGFVQVHHEISDVRKDMEKMELRIVVKLSAVMVACATVLGIVMTLLLGSLAS